MVDATGGAPQIQMRDLGRAGPRTSALGLGTMGMSDLYGPADEGEAVATIHAALDAGVTLLDTGDFYGSGRNELLIARALRNRRRADVTLSVKFGALRDPAGGWLGTDGRPAAVKNFLAHSLSRLGTEAGYVRHVGLSEVGAATIRRAAAVHPIGDVQIEYSLLSRGIEDEILPTCRELGIGVTAYGVLSRGLLSGHWSRERDLSGHDFRAFQPRFRGRDLERNLALVEALRQSRRRRARRSPRLRSPGCCRAATTSSRWSARARGSGWPSRWPRPTSSSRPRTSPASRRRSRPAPPPARATPSR
jgi:aryl-alcohol dehydrogenase-like predicted oxidoreductase